MFRRSAAPLLIGTFILRANSGASNVVLGLLLAQIASHTAHSITSLQVGLLPVAFYICELTLAPLMGGLSDRWGRRNFLIVGPFLGLINVSLFIFTPAINPMPYLLTLQVLAGLSGAVTTPAVLGYLADFTVENSARRMRIMSLYELATGGGIAAGTVLGGFAWDHFGRLAFAVLASCYLLAALCMVLSPVMNQVFDHDKLSVVGARYWRIIRTPRLFIFIPAWICIMALVGVWLSSQVVFILSMHVHNADQLLMGSMSGVGSGRRIGVILSGFVLVFGLSLLFWAFFLNRVSRLRLMLTSVAGIYLGCIALAAINHRGEGNNGVLLIWIPILLVSIFAETGFAPAALAYLADISESAAKDRGLVMGLYSIFLAVGQIVGNGLGGVFAHRFGFDGLLYLTVILASVALASLLWLFSQERKQAT